MSVRGSRWQVKPHCASSFLYNKTFFRRGKLDWIFQQLWEFQSVIHLDPIIYQMLVNCRGYKLFKKRESLVFPSGSNGSAWPYSTGPVLRVPLTWPRNANAELTWGPTSCFAAAWRSDLHIDEEEGPRSTSTMGRMYDRWCGTRWEND